MYCRVKIINSTVNVLCGRGRSVFIWEFYEVGIVIIFILVENIGV